MSQIPQAFAAALAHHRASRFDQAEQIYRQILAVNPNDSNALHLLGALSLEIGKTEDAVELIGRAIAVSPTHAMFHSNLGQAYLKLGKLDEALASLRRALGLNPAHVHAHIGSGHVLEAQGKLAEATVAYRRAVQAMPNYPDAHFALGVALGRQQENDQAVASFHRALELRPDWAEALNGLGNVFEDQGRFDEAEDCCRRVVELRPDWATAHFNLGNVLNEQRRYDQAAAAYRRALELDPHHEKALYNLATVFDFQGEHDEAVQHFDRMIALDPKCGGAFYSRAHSKRYTDDDRGEIEAAEAMLDRDDLPRHDRSQIHFALGKAYDDCGSWDRAFGHFRRANRLADVHFDQEATIASVDALIETFDEDFFAQRTDFGHSGDLPIFIVGMPRSATTLVEQILASHPDVFGAGELNDIGAMCVQIPQVVPSGRPFPQGAADLDPRLAEALGDQYYARLRRLAPDARHVTDKMPMNFFQLGLIAMLLPRAKVIHCRRDPLDVCLSCYFTSFTHRLYFAYDLHALSVFYQLYEKLMNHWRKVLPMTILDVDYEELVGNQEDVARRLVSFCGLPWHPECLEFHTNRRPILSSSSWQVRQPIYSRSLGRWKRYKKHLGPLKETLVPIRRMRFDVCDETLAATTKCTSDFACLSTCARTDSGRCLGKASPTREDLLLVDCKEDSCPYGSYIGELRTCACPVRNEIYRLHGV